jgi:hypothetical protein
MSMTSQNAQPKTPAPEWLRALNATFTAWNSFVVGCSLFLVACLFAPSLNGLTGTLASMLLVSMLIVAVLVAIATTRWQVRRMKLSSKQSHILLLVALLMLSCLTLPAPMAFVIS